VPINKTISQSQEVQAQVVRLTIPPPAIPQPESSLFPENSVPDVIIPPSSEVIDLASESMNEFASLTPEEENPSDVGSNTSNDDGLTLARLREEAHRLADMGLSYQFGSDDPDEGGLDCSGVIQHMLTDMGVKGVPRTSYNQYAWLKRNKTLQDVSGKSASSKLLKRLSPGDLIFWGGTWDSGHKVSHVMLYMGYNPNEDKHYIFGARSKSSKGLLGNGVDVFELDPNRGRLIAHGRIPGIKY
tara:strand:+ start:223 stop:951 length:729 start_codon:yes stop_codon:yes gene_type:complete